MLLAVTIPPNVGPGQAMQVIDPTTGKTYQIAVPYGASPGSVIHVQCASRSPRTQEQIVTMMRLAGCAVVGVASVLASAIKYVHDKGWDRRVLRAGAASISAAGRELFGSNTTIHHIMPAGGDAQSFYVVVPPNVAAGQTLVVLAPNNQQVMVEVPAGAPPGTQFMVQM